MPARPTRTLLAGLALALTATLAGCSGGDASQTAFSDGPDPASSSARTSASTPVILPPSTPPSTPPTSPTSAAPSTSFPTYVALGDSYTAAPGVPTTETNDGCSRSSGNYPTLLAAQLGSKLTDVSCSGASTSSLVGVQRTSKAAIPAQFDALTTDTSLVTLGMGGNDESLFATAIGTCVGGAYGSDATGHPCRDANATTGTRTGDALLDKVKVIGGLVTAALKGVVDRSPDAKVVLVGYPQPVPASGTCPILPLATGDYAYLRTVFASLNAALQIAAKRAGATYVDVAAASKGHDICASDPWVNGVADAPGRAIAFHPFAEEQQAVAGLIATALQAS